MILNAEQVEKVLQDLQHVVRDSEELLRVSIGAVGAKALEVRGRLAHSLESAKVTCSRLQEKAKRSVKDTDKVIRDHPYQSIGVAFGIGVLIGLFLTRKQ